MNANSESQLPTVLHEEKANSDHDLDLGWTMYNVEFVQFISYTTTCSSLKLFDLLFFGVTTYTHTHTHARTHAHTHTHTHTHTHRFKVILAVLFVQH